MLRLKYNLVCMHFILIKPKSFSKPELELHARRRTTLLSDQAGNEINVIEIEK